MNKLCSQYAMLCSTGCQGPWWLLRDSRRWHSRADGANIEPGICRMLRAVKILIAVSYASLISFASTFVPHVWPIGFDTRPARAITAFAFLITAITARLPGVRHTPGSCGARDFAPFPYGSAGQKSTLHIGETRKALRLPSAIRQSQASVIQMDSSVRPTGGAGSPAAVISLRRRRPVSGCEIADCTPTRTSPSA